MCQSDKCAATHRRASTRRMARTNQGRGFRLVTADGHAVRILRSQLLQGLFHLDTAQSAGHTNTHTVPETPSLSLSLLSVSISLCLFCLSLSLPPSISLRTRLVFALCSSASLNLHLGDGEAKEILRRGERVLAADKGMGEERGGQGAASGLTHEALCQQGMELAGPAHPDDDVQRWDEVTIKGMRSIEKERGR